MPHNLQIQKLLVKADSAPSPDDRIKLLKEAIQIADSHNDVEWGFDLRKDLIETEKGTSRCIEGLPAFTWILEAYHNNPDIFDETEFMLEYKWMVAAARRNASVSMQQVESILEDYKSRLQPNGYSLHSYYSARTHLAFMLNKLDDAKQYLALREKEEHDDLSFCIACEINDKAELEFRQGNIDNALMVGADLFSGKIDCRYIPFQTCCNSINLLVSEGYTAKAAEFFTTADTTLQTLQDTDMSNIGYVGKLIRYLTTVDANKAWAYFEKYAAWSLNCEDEFDLQFSLNVLPLLKSDGTRTLQVNSEMPWYHSDNMYDVAQLYDYYYNRAVDLTQRFDARNGTVTQFPKM